MMFLSSRTMMIASFWDDIGRNANRASFMSSEGSQQI
jgi:hypothetical protein